MLHVSTTMKSSLVALASALLLHGTSGAQVQFEDITDAAGLAVPQGAGLKGQVSKSASVPGWSSCR